MMGESRFIMKLRVGLVAAIVGGLSVAVLADARSDAKAQVTFAITLAQKGLWNEATLRFKNATTIDPTYAAAWNNLAIGCEQLGRFDDAKKAYEKAMELEPKNEHIRTNYESFREIYDRQNKARGR
jgi:Flp pilus assembly protein TadD